MSEYQIFSDIAGMILTLVVAYLIYRIGIKVSQSIDILFNIDMKYGILNEIYLDKFAKEKGIDLNKELVKRDILSKKRKSFRAKIEDQIYEDMFKQENKEMK